MNPPKIIVFPIRCFKEVAFDSNSGSFSFITLTPFTLTQEMLLTFVDNDEVKWIEALIKS
jgi:hypothetical protein